jgi:hypothetical protein
MTLPVTVPEPVRVPSWMFTAVLVELTLPPFRIVEPAV